MRILPMCATSYNNSVKEKKYRSYVGCGNADHWCYSLISIKRNVLSNVLFEIETIRLMEYLSTLEKIMIREMTS